MALRGTGVDWCMLAVAVLAPPGLTATRAPGSKAVGQVSLRQWIVRLGRNTATAAWLCVLLVCIAIKICELGYWLHFARWPDWTVATGLRAVRIQEPEFIWLGLHQIWMGISLQPLLPSFMVAGFSFGAVTLGAARGLSKLLPGDR